MKAGKKSGRGGLFGGIGGLIGGAIAAFFGKSNCNYSWYSCSGWTGCIVGCQ